jgi:phage antirepressor YoqD-like protein
VKYTITFDAKSETIIVIEGKDDAGLTEVKAVRIATKQWQGEVPKITKIVREG